MAVNTKSLIKAQALNTIKTERFILPRNYGKLNLWCNYWDWHLAKLNMNINFKENTLTCSLSGEIYSMKLGIKNNYSDKINIIMNFVNQTKLAGPKEDRQQLVTLSNDEQQSIKLLIKRHYGLFNNSRLTKTIFINTRLKLVMNLNLHIKYIQYPGSLNSKSVLLKCDKMLYAI